MNEKKFTATLSKSGLPCLWEEGGGYTSTGNAVLIADAKCQPKTAIYVKKRGDLACKEHALVPIKRGDHIMEANHHRGDFNMSLWQVDRIEDRIVYTVLVNEYSEGQWKAQFTPEQLINATMGKATDYHCRKPYFVNIKEEGGKP